MPNNDAAPDVLLVVPTLGRRMQYLDATLQSIQDQSVKADVVIVAPLDASGIREAADRYGTRLLADPGSLPAAINRGIAEFGEAYAFVGWLNDDDLLEPGSLASTTEALGANPAAVVAFGSCRYIDASGRELWVSRAGKWAPWILPWGPDLIPQPGMLVRSQAWRAVGGVDPDYRLVFDLDLLLRLRKIGRLIDCGCIVSSFRWHADSLTVDNRATNLDEGERAKRAALGPTAQSLAWLWEKPVRIATRLAANEVSRRARKLGAG